MNYSEACLERIKRYEGLRDLLPDGRVAAYQQRYTDPKTGKTHVDIPTIGWGCTEDVEMGMIWTVEQCETGLKRELAKKVARVNALVKVDLTQNQFDALLCLAHNIGTEEDGLKTSTLLRKLNAGDFAGAHAEFARWVYSGGVYVKGLANRRSSEAALFSRRTEEEEATKPPRPMPQTVDAPVDPLLTPNQKAAALTVATGAGATIVNQTVVPMITAPPAPVVQTVENAGLWMKLGKTAGDVGVSLWQTPEALAIAASVAAIVIWAPRILKTIKG